MDLFSNAAVRKIIVEGFAGAAARTEWKFADDALESEAADNNASNKSSSTLEDDSQPSEDQNQEQKLSKSKKRRNKRKKRAANSSASEPRISWRPVTEHLFSRQLAADTVPKSGCFPLGLGEFVESYTIPLDEHISNSQAILSARMRDISPKGAPAPEEGVYYETRQWDFKRSVSNPLFGAMREADRANLLNALDIRPSALNELKHQLEKLRISRDNTKCSCKPMKSVDKLSVTKLKHELSTRSVASPSELDALTKPELMRLLKERLKDEPLCNANNCECFRLGVECHFDICGCCHKQSQLQHCGNPYGKYEYDARAVNMFRKRILFPDTWMELLAAEAATARPHADSVVSLPTTDDGLDGMLEQKATDALDMGGVDKEQEEAIASSSSSACELTEDLPEMISEQMETINSAECSIPCSTAVKTEGGIESIPHANDLGRKLLQMLSYGSSEEKMEQSLSKDEDLDNVMVEADTNARPNHPASKPRKKTKGDQPKQKVWKVKQKDSTVATGRIHHETA